jgi:hypothetical protein
MKIFPRARLQPPQRGQQALYRTPVYQELAEAEELPTGLAAGSRPGRGAQQSCHARWGATSRSPIRQPAVLIQQQPVSVAPAPAPAVVFYALLVPQDEGLPIQPLAPSPHRPFSALLCAALQVPLYTYLDRPAECMHRLLLQQAILYSSPAAHERNERVHRILSMLHPAPSPVQSVCGDVVLLLRHSSLALFQQLHSAGGGVCRGLESAHPWPPAGQGQGDEA